MGPQIKLVMTGGCEVSRCEDPCEWMVPFQEKDDLNRAVLSSGDLNIPFLSSVNPGSALMSQKGGCAETVVFHLLQKFECETTWGRKEASKLSMMVWFCILFISIRF